MSNGPKVNFASSMIVEDHLKKVLSLTDKSKRAWRVSDNKLLPRAQHSVFGNFSKETMAEFYRKKKLGEVPATENAEQSQATDPKRK
jgi:hypothetical protein